jgi:Flp pilus assembly protein TadD
MRSEPDRLARAQLLLEQSRYDQAERELRAGLVQWPQDARLHAMLAVCLLPQERWAEATGEAAEAVRLAPDWSGPHAVMASVLRARGRLDEAEQAVGAAIRIDPDDAGHLSLLAAIRIERGAWRPALEAAEQALAFDPEHTTAANLRAVALVNLGRKADAGVALGTNLARDPDNAATHLHQGQAMLHAGNHRAALVAFQEALRLDPTMDQARQGVLMALKARNPVYGLLLRYSLWMSRVSARVGWAVILGAFLVAQFLGPYTWIYLIIVLVTWTADPVANLVLRLHPYGRLLLDREQVVSSNWFGACLLTAGVLAAGGFALGSPALRGGGFGLLLLTMPLSAVWRCAEGWPRTVMATWTAGCLVLIAAGTGLTFAAGDITPSPLLAIGSWGAALGTWAAMFLVSRTVRH